MTIGIYKLKFNSDAFYIGQSINIEKRYRDHLSQLKSDKSNFKMLEEFSKWGNPTLYILEDCEMQDLDPVEEYYITKFNATVYPGLNIMSKPSGSPIRIQNTKVYEQIFFLLLDNKLKNKEIALHLDVSEFIVKNISRGESQVWLKDKYPIEYDRMLNTNRKCKTNRIVKNRPLLQAPNGTAYDLSGQNVKEFAKAQSVNVDKLYSILNGKIKEYMGWMLFKEQECQN